MGRGAAHRRRPRIDARAPWSRAVTGRGRSGATDTGRAWPLTGHGRGLSCRARPTAARRTGSPNIATGKEPPMTSIAKVAREFFDACEAGKGWDACKAYCLPDATFSAQAEPLADVHRLQQYTEWMKGLMGFI